MKHSIIRSALSGVLAAGLVLTTVTISPTRTGAGTLSTAIIAMFPKNVGEFAYADLKSARKFSWFSQLNSQVLPPRFKQFEQFLGSSGVDPNSQVEEIAWANITSGKGDDVVGIALGQFDPSAAETKLKAQKVPVFEVQGFHLYAFGSGAAAGDILFVFFDANTAAFGNRSVLEHLINVRMGGEETLLTGKLFPLITEANGNGIIWAVLDKDHTHLAMQQLVPQASQFPQAAAIIERMHAMIININADDGVDAHFQAVCDSVDDANLLSAAMQAGLMYRRYQEAQTNPALAKTIDQVRVTPSGDRLKVDAPVSQDQLMSHIQTTAVAAPM
ncbi:MAG: hypothetical protein WCA00_08950 [Candidatus Acidiferrales bacterium]